MSDTTPPLLATKLHAPVPRRGMVERPRLADRLAGGALPALTLVSAPAGFGKTTLLAGWFAAIRAQGRAAAWVSLDPGDNDPTVFWSYVVAALRTAVPEVGAGALALLAAAQPQEAVVASLINDLAGLATEVVLVLDDHHVIDSAELHTGLAYLLDHLPGQVHLVLGTRADPSLPLARLRSRGELVEVRAADLRFTADEAAAYLAGAVGGPLTADQVGALEARTEGWIAALQLAALSMQGRDDPGRFIASFAGDDRFVVDYLAEEVLERQPAEVRAFLLHTSVLDRFTGALCDAVTGVEGGRAMLERLDRANLFLVALDDRRQWYRYHHLFADVLRARLADEQPALEPELHRRAGRWYEAAGDRAQAITHALAGHDTEEAARLIELVAPTMFRTRQEATFRRWIAALPDGIFADRPVLSIEAVGARMVNGELAGVGPLLAGIDRWLAPGADLAEAVVYERNELPHLPAQVAVYRAALALIGGHPTETIDHANRALDLALASDHLRRGSAAALLGLAHWTVGDLEPAERRYTESLASLTAAGHISDVLGCSLALADIQITLGRLGDAAAACTSGLELARAHGVVRGTADLHIELCEVLLERDDRTGARRHLEAGTRLGEAAGLPQHPYRWRVAAARMAQADGDRTTALALLAEAEAVYNTDMSPAVRPVSAVLARARLAAGDRAAARRWAVDSGLLPIPPGDLVYRHEYAQVTLARILLADPAGWPGDPAEDAVELLERLLAGADAGGRTGSAVEILVLLALAHHAAGHPAPAAAALDRALERAGPEGQARVFLDEQPALTLLLADATRQPGTAGEHARHLLAADAPAADTSAAVDRRSPAGPARPGLVDELSPRELDVLRLLRSDLTGPAMARELLVSLNTLRTHTRSIYQKLGATNRRQAVRRADELGL